MEEIDSIEGELTYEAVQNLEYLEMVLMESLRLHNPGAIFNRVCTKDYVLRGLGIPLKKGQPVHINVVGIHGDPQYYPSGGKFDPENFNSENKEARSP